MRCVDVTKGIKPVITVENSLLGFKWYTRYEADRKLVGHYYVWLQLPKRLIVQDALSLQLDEWLLSGGK